LIRCTSSGSSFSASAVKVGKIGEQDRHLSALALDGGAGLQDLLGEVLRRVGGEPLVGGGRGLGGGGAGRGGRADTFARGHAVTTLEAELRSLGIVVPAGRAQHQRTNRRPSARACSSASRTASPFSRAIRRTSSNSGVTVTILPSSLDTL